MLIATRPFRYGTRRLQAGEDFEARNPRDARLLIAVGRARAPDPGELPVAAPPAPPPSDIRQFDKIDGMIVDVTSDEVLAAHGAERRAPEPMPDEAVPAEAVPAAAAPKAPAAPRGKSGAKKA